MFASSFVVVFCSLLGISDGIPGTRFDFGRRLWIAREQKRPRHRTLWCSANVSRQQRSPFLSDVMNYLKSAGISVELSVGVSAGHANTIKPQSHKKSFLHSPISSYMCKKKTNVTCVCVEAKRGWTRTDSHLNGAVWHYSQSFSLLSFLLPFIWSRERRLNVHFAGWRLLRNAKVG